MINHTCTCTCTCIIVVNEIWVQECSVIMIYNWHSDKHRNDITVLSFTKWTVFIPLKEKIYIYKSCFSEFFFSSWRSLPSIPDPVAILLSMCIWTAQHNWDN